MFSQRKDIKISFCHLVHVPGVGLWSSRGSKKNSQHGHVAYQIEKDDEYNTIQVKFYPRVKLVTLGLRSEAWGYAMARHRLQDLVYH